MERIVPRILWLAVALSALLIVSALVPTSITAPENPISPRAVFLIDHGTHSSLAIETSDGKMLRYSYGDFRYYALRDTSLAAGAAAVLWPTPATLGRGELSAPANSSNLGRQLVVVVEKIYQLEVAAARADRLISQLDAIYLQGTDALVEVPEYGLVFAPHPVDYLWSSNSSTMIGLWLRELGAEVFGWAMISSWSLGTN